MKIDPDTWYAPGSPEMDQIAQPQTFANWRCAGIGPSYSKIGRRVLYKGETLLQLLSARQVETEAA